MRLQAYGTCLAAPTAADAARGADVVVLATTSTVPVLDAATVEPGTHLTTVGPKWTGAHETPLELLRRAAVITCDSPQQAAAYPDPAADITVHCSVGLAGTEVIIAAALLASQETGELR